MSPCARRERANAWAVGVEQRDHVVRQRFDELGLARPVAASNCSSVNTSEW
jgi:hypothetical protein